jgi:hypothetical protein
LMTRQMRPSTSMTLPARMALPLIFIGRPDC